MPSLTPFWRLLETRPSRTAVINEWQRVAGGCFSAVYPLLQPNGHLARVYPSARGGLRVVHHDDGSIIGVDEGDWEHRKDLTHNDIVLYGVDLPRLRKAISDALSGVQISRTAVDATGARMQIGNWEPKKAAAFPIFLLLCRTRSALRERVADLATTLLKSGAIVMTPTRETWDDDIIALARSHRVLLVAVGEVIDVVGDTWVQATGWNEYLAAFCQMVGTTLPANFRNKNKPARRSQRAANIEKLEKAIGDHIHSVKKHAYSLKERGREPALLPRPEQQFLAAQLGMTTTTVSRCLNDPKAKMLRMLWETAESLEAVLKFRG